MMLRHIVSTRLEPSAMIALRLIQPERSRGEVIRDLIIYALRNRHSFVPLFKSSSSAICKECMMAWDNAVHWTETEKANVRKLELEMGMARATTR